MRQLGKALWVCFVDLRKAFPSVERELLWNRLAESGITWLCWRALRALYKTTQACARGCNSFSAPFDISRGILEGDTLGPLLWAIFFSPCAEEIARVALAEGWTELADLWDAATPLDSAWAVWCLLFADDTALVAVNEATLQKIILIFEQFCERNLLEINMKKTVGVVFRSPDTQWLRVYEKDAYLFTSHDIRSREPLFRKVVIRMGGAPLKFEHEFVYVGSLLHETLGLEATASRAVGEGRKALSAFLAGIQLAPSLPFRILLHVGHALVMGTVLVNTALWGASKEGRKMVDGLQAEFLQRVCGGRKNTTVASLLVATGSGSWSVQALELVARYIARPAAMGPLLRRTVALAQTGHWATEVSAIRRLYISTARTHGCDRKPTPAARMEATTIAIAAANIEERLQRDADRPYSRTYVMSNSTTPEREGIRAIIHECHSPTSRALVARFFLGLDGAARVHGHWWLRKGRGPLPQHVADRLFGPEPRTEDGKRCCLHCRVRDRHRTPAGAALPPFVIESEAHVLLCCPREDARRLRVGLPAAPSLAGLLQQAGSSRDVARAAAQFLIGALPDRAREIEKRLRRPH